MSCHDFSNLFLKCPLFRCRSERNENDGFASHLRSSSWTEVPSALRHSFAESLPFSSDVIVTASAAPCFLHYEDSGVDDGASWRPSPSAAVPTQVTEPYSELPFFMEDDISSSDDEMATSMHLAVIQEKDELEPMSPVQMRVSPVDNKTPLVGADVDTCSEQVDSTGTYLLNPKHTFMSHQHSAPNLVDALHLEPGKTVTGSSSTNANGDSIVQELKASEAGAYSSKTDEPQACPGNEPQTGQEALYADMVRPMSKKRVKSSSVIFYDEYDNTSTVRDDLRRRSQLEPLSAIEQLVGDSKAFFDQICARKNSILRQETNLDRNISASTPAIDQIVPKMRHPRAVVAHKEPACQEKTKAPRAISLVVPAISPRLPLIGLFPKSVVRNSDKPVFAKSKEKVGKLRSSRKYMSRAKEKKAHFWIKLGSSASDVSCEACGKPFSQDGYQCNDCLIYVHSSCKDAADRFGCVKCKQESEPDLVRHFSMFLPERSFDSRKFNTTKSDSVSVFSQNSLSFESDNSGVESPDVLNVAAAGDRRRSAGEFNYINNIPTEWKELDLWQSDSESWSGGRGKTERKKLSSKEIKRQDIIHELHVTERHHCRTVVVTKYIYYNGLQSHRILNTDELDTLMPGLDDILRAHYHFLSLLTQKMSSTVVVEGIHEVLLQQFTGEVSEKMIDAYVKFCSQKEASVKAYHRLMITNSGFRNFMENLSQLPFYKGKSFPDCLLLITQRLSKYHTLVESLRKNTSDDSPEKDGMAEAEKAVKQVVMRVDLGIEKVQLKQTRDAILILMDNKASTMFQGNAFTKKDLTRDGRELMYAGDVFWQNARRKPTEVTMLLFNDVIVFLQRNGSSYTFFTQDKKDAIVSLRKLIVRDKAGRLGSQGIYLISAAQDHAEMYEIICKTKKQLAAWTDRIQKAVYQCPEQPEIREAPVESQVNAEEFEHLKLLLDKIRQLTDSRKQLHDRQLKLYEETCDYINHLNVQNDDDRTKLLRLIDDCIPPRSALQRSTTKLSDLMGQIMRERCINQFLSIASSSSSSSTVATASGGESHISRSHTFHGLRSSGRKNMPSRTRSTVSGISDLAESTTYHSCEDIFQRHDSGPLPSATEPKGVPIPTFDSLSRVVELEAENQKLKQEKFLLTAELMKEKNPRSYSNLATYSTGLEELRRLHGELEVRREEFSQFVTNKRIELDNREKAVKEKEETLEREDAELQSKWEYLRTAWENHRITGVHIPALSQFSAPAKTNTNTCEFPPPVPTFSVCSTAPAAPISQPSCAAAVSETRLAQPAYPASLKSSVSFSDLYRRCLVPPYLQGSSVHGGRLPEQTVRQQLPSKLLKDDMLNSISAKFQGSVKEKKKKKSKSKNNSESSSGDAASKNASGGKHKK